jgi:SAM-dependent methyltransferase
MIDFPITEKSLLLDIGCSSGTLTRVLSRKAPTVSADIDKNTLVWFKRHAKHLDLVCADLCNLPFRNDSVDIAVCASVLEHVENLEKATQQIRFVLKEDGILVAGYPIETTLLKAVIELICRETVSVWDPRKVMRNEDYRTCPHTHKQKFPAIRDTLGRYFSILKKEKMPLTCLPDFLSIYECAKMGKSQSRRRFIPVKR